MAFSKSAVVASAERQFGIVKMRPAIVDCHAAAAGFCNDLAYTPVIFGKNVQRKRFGLRIDISCGLFERFVFAQNQYRTKNLFLPNFSLRWNICQDSRRYK